MGSIEASPEFNIGNVLSKADGLEGLSFVSSLACSVIEHVRQSALGSSEENSDLLFETGKTLLPVWSLGWTAHIAETELTRSLACSDPLEVLLCAGQDALSVLVCAQLLFDNVTFTRSYSQLRRKFNAVDKALPLGCAPCDFPLFGAVDVLASVYEVRELASSYRSEQPDSGTAERVALPMISQLVAVEQAAVEMDEPQNFKDSDQRPWGIKTTSYLMRCADLLPLPSSRQGRRIDGIEAFYESILELSQRSLHRDRRSSNGNSDVRFRCARCLYALGDIEGAQAEMVQAVELYDGTSVLISEQYFVFQQRLEQEEAANNRAETILADFNTAMNRSLEDATNHLQHSAENAERQTRKQIADATFRVVEILGVFLALIGIMATTVGTAVFADGSVPQRAGLLAGGWLGCLLFFVLMRRIVHPDRPSVKGHSRLRSGQG